MKHFLFKVEDRSDRRGFNQVVSVYLMNRGYPKFVGRNDEINTASSYGDLAEAVRVLAAAMNYKMADEYTTVRTDYTLYQI